MYFAFTDNQIKGLYQSLGHPEWFTDPRFATREARHTDNNNEILGTLIADAFREFDTHHIAGKLHEHSVPCGEVTEIAETFDNPQIRHNQTFYEWEHPTAGKVRSPRHSTLFSKTKLTNLASAPILNEHADEIMTELGIGKSHRDLLKEDGIVP